MLSKFVLLTTVSVMFALSAPDLRTVVLEGAGVEAMAPSYASSRPLPATPDTAAVAEPEPVVPSNPVADAVETALATLEKRVARQSHPDALRHAFGAYYSYKATHPTKVRKPYLYFVDFGLDSRTPRGYVFDMESLSVVEGPFPVAHGRGSVRSGETIPTRFSNKQGSNATSLGLYLAQETYGFRGKSGGRAYRSVGLRLQGVSGSFNSAARARGIVAHGAPYVTAQRAGRSEGCPAMTQALAEKLLPRIANGGMVFHFSPLDTGWLANDPWVSRASGKLAVSN